MAKPRKDLTGMSEKEIDAYFKQRLANKKCYEKRKADRADRTDRRGPGRPPKNVIRDGPCSTPQRELFPGEFGTLGSLLKAR